MVLIEWSDDYSVQVAEIDEQHKVLVGYINDLHEALESGKDDDTLQDVLNGLIDYTTEHFSKEEEYFNKFGYEDEVPHRNEHKQFVVRIVNFKRGAAGGGEALSQEVLDFMKTWLIGHINGSDKKYTQCFRDNGLE